MSNFNELIFSNFEKALNDYKKHSIEKSKHWQKHYNNKIDKFMNLDNLINFRSYNTWLAQGIDNAYDNKRTTFTFFVEILQELGSEFVFNNLNKKNVGNCDNAYKIDDRFFDKDFIYQFQYFNDLAKLVFSKKKIKTVFEIGGGFGHLARIILNNYDCKYFCIDLPEANLLTSYYLHESLPPKKIYTYDDYLKEKDGFVSSDNIDNFDIFILPPWAKFNDELKIDLFINTRSMMEIEFAVIKKYFNIIHKSISDDGFFLNINRYTKDTVGYPINFSDYPYDNNWEVTLSKKSFKQPHIHFLLTQRKFSNFKNNIKDEIKKIKIESKKYQETSIAYKRRSLKDFMVYNFWKIFKILFKKSFVKKLGYKLLSLE